MLRRAKRDLEAVTIDRDALEELLNAAPQSPTEPGNQAPAVAAPCDAWVQGHDSDHCQRCGLGEFEHGQIY
jgi:hypothetical protein